MDETAIDPHKARRHAAHREIMEELAKALKMDGVTIPNQGLPNTEEMMFALIDAIVEQIEEWFGEEGSE